MLQEHKNYNSNGGEEDSFEAFAGKVEQQYSEEQGERCVPGILLCNKSPQNLVD